MVLDEKHQKVAIEIVQKNQLKKNCNKCYGRGYIGYSPDKTIIPCEKCVNLTEAMNQWKEYVSADEVLKEEYKDLFVEKDESELEEENHSDKQKSKNDSKQKNKINTKLHGKDMGKSEAKTRRKSGS